MFLENLKNLINEKCFHLLSHQINMSYLNGIGSISYIYNDFELHLINFLKKDFLIYKRKNVIYFFKKELIKDEELIEKSFFQLWNELSNIEAIKFLNKKYNIPQNREIDNEYWYNLDCESNTCINFYTFFTRGSEINEDRHIEHSFKELELDEYQRCLKPIEINNILKEDFLNEINKINLDRLSLYDITNIYNNLKNIEFIKLNENNQF